MEFLSAHFTPGVTPSMDVVVMKGSDDAVFPLLFTRGELVERGYIIVALCAVSVFLGTRIHLQV